mmetsp:Transcript_13312/g.19162  ORF Transcript_13312/g.19162 Transcript_13312/m.19162 type:complete len:110 (+) Transcript_13312:272-601(+)
MAVPPDIQGESVRLTRAGGVWDAMKRIVCWHVPILASGELMEIQAQFDVCHTTTTKTTTTTTTPKFPVLVRCDARNDQFSEIELRLKDDHNGGIHMNLTTGVRIVHRKV